MNNLNADFFKNNRHKLVSAITDAGIIIIPGNGQMQRTSDTAYTFRQDSNLYYLTGINEPCATLVIDTLNSHEWIMLPSRDDIHTFFDGMVDITKIQQTSGVNDIVSEQVGWKRIRELRDKQMYIPKKPASRLGAMYTNPHRAIVSSKISRLASKPIIDIRTNLSELRMIKSPLEQKLIARAANITYTALKTIKSDISSYGSEREIEAELTKQIIINGADGHGYSPIIASGLNSCTLHYIANNSNLTKGSVLLFDVGAEFSGYSADISRTVVYGLKQTARQAEVIAAVAEAQSEIINLLKPGLTFKELAEQSENIVASKLVNLHLIPKAYNQKDIRKYFPHSVSHFLGLDVHDAGNYSKSLMPGMVITIEPGIYISDESIGVRIEDDVVITENSACILGDKLPALL